MISAMNFVRATKFAAMILAGLSLTACANNPNQLTGANAGLAGSAAPGSAQDFVVNVGDRVFFESDSTELTPQSIATLDKQAQWLARSDPYPVAGGRRAGARGASKYTSARGARRAQAVRDYLTSRGVQASRM